MIRDKKGRVIDPKTGDPIQHKRQLNDAALRIIEKHGGQSFGGNVRITDSETGSVVYDNSDVTKMAKQYVQLGGEAYYSDLKKHLGDERANREYRLNVLSKMVSCSECGKENRKPYTSIYMVYYRKLPEDSGYLEEIDKRDFWWCDSCGCVNKVISLPENEEEKKLVLERIEEIFNQDDDVDRKKYRFL